MENFLYTRSSLAVIAVIKAGERFVEPSTSRLAINSTKGNAGSHSAMGLHSSDIFVIKVADSNFWLFDE
jgi:hypothetical protein